MMRQGDNLIVMINQVNYMPDMVHCPHSPFCRMNGIEINEASKFLASHHNTSNHLIMIANPKIDVDPSTLMKKNCMVLYLQHLVQPRFILMILQSPHFKRDRALKD